MMTDHLHYLKSRYSISNHCSRQFIQSYTKYKTLTCLYKVRLHREIDLITFIWSFECLYCNYEWFALMRVRSAWIVRPKSIIYHIIIAGTLKRVAILIILEIQWDAKGQSEGTALDAMPLLLWIQIWRINNAREKDILFIFFPDVNAFWLTITLVNLFVVVVKDRVPASQNPLRHHNPI